MEYGLRMGQTVHTLDGDKIGEVKEVRGDYFKVDASMQPDYWLSCECIRGGAVAGEKVMLNFDKDKLGDMKVDEKSVM